MPVRLALLLCLSLAVAGCRQPGTPAAATSAQKSFPVRGRIVSADTATGQVMLDHEAIPGYMEAMTMQYHLADPAVASELHPGDRITAHLVLDATRGDDPSGYRKPRLEQVVIVGQARPDYKPKVQYHVPEAGQSIPDFKLLNQSAKTIHLAQFQGKVVLLTFIYTRCPLADFCPRMSRNFADIDKALQADPSLYAATHLLSISFDPAYDTPAILRKYGEAYTGNNTKDFHHWDFATPSAADLPTVTQFFNVGITGADNPAYLSHSLSTILIGKDGKIAGWYPSNDWKVDDMMQQIRKAATA